MWHRYRALTPGYRTLTESQKTGTESQKTGAEQSDADDEDGRGETAAAADAILVDADVPDSDKELLGDM